MAEKIQLRRDSAATWASVNPVLSDGEPGYERDTGRIKVGNGSQAWNDLSYANDAVGGDASFEFAQPTASALWTINHNLGKRPSVQVFDSTGDEVEGAVSHVSVNQLTVEFSAAFSGHAYLN